MQAVLVTGPTATQNSIWQLHHHVSACLGYEITLYRRQQKILG